MYITRVCYAECRLIGSIVIIRDLAINDQRSMDIFFVRNIAVLTEMLGILTINDNLDRRQ